MTYARARNGVDIAAKEQEIYHDVHNLEWCDGVIAVDSAWQAHGGGETTGRKWPKHSQHAFQKAMAGKSGRTRSDTLFKVAENDGNAYLEEDPVLP